MNKLRSSAITQGVQRSPNRSMLRAVGFKDEDFDKPIIGIVGIIEQILYLFCSEKW